MSSIVSARTTLDDRNPIVSFVVNVPPERWFEVACATDPALLRPEARDRRTPRNFYSSRAGGLLRAPAGQATVLVEPSQVLRFAGASKLYYTLGTYTGPNAEDAEFTVAPAAAERAPSIRIAPDFTGRALDRARLSRPSADARYGDPSAHPLVWGGDIAHARRDDRLGDPRARVAYDDGFDPGLWSRDAREPDGYEDARDLARHGGRAETYGAVDAPPLDEPDGYEDAPALRRAQGETYGAVEEPPLGEPDGYEDAPALRRAQGETYGDPRRRVAARAAEDDDAAVDDHYPDYNDDPDMTWEEGAAAESLEAPPTPLDDAAQVRVIWWTAQFESRRRYDAVNANRDGQGLSWGIVQFSQRSGSLGRLLAACRAALPDFDAVVGGADIADELLAVTQAKDPDARLAPVRGNTLWSDAWRSIFAQLAAKPEVVRCQNVAAVEYFFKPNLRFAQWMGFDTDRALAVLFDRCVQMGNGGGTSWIAATAAPLDRAASLKSLGYDSLSAFQRARGLVVDGRWGPRSHAALVDALRARGGAGLPDLAAMLQRLAEDAAQRALSGERAAMWADIARRTATIVSDTTRLTDARYALPVAP